MPTSSKQGANWWLVLAMIVAFVLTCVAFWPATTGSFVELDDEALLIENTAYRAPWPGVLQWCFSNTLLGHYQPLTWVSYALEHAASGVPATEPVPPGLVLRNNIVLHATTAGLVVLLIARLLSSAAGLGSTLTAGRRATIALLAGLLWAAHPLRAESVAWATERRDVLSILFLVGAVHGYLSFCSGGPRRWWWYVSSLGLVVLSLLSKAWGMSLAVVLVTIDWGALSRLPVSPLRWLERGPRRVLLEKVPYLLLGIAAAVMAGFAQKSAPGAVRTLEEWSITDRAIQAIHGLTWYLQKSLVPLDLYVIVQLPIGQPAPVGEIAARAGMLIAIVGIGIWLARRWRGPLATFGAYGILLGPILGVLQSGDQYVADRYSYVALIPWSVLLAAILARGASRAKPRGHVLSIASLVVAIAIVIPATRAQTRVWNNSFSLWEHAARVEPRATMSRTNLAMVHLRMGRTAEAVVELEAVIAIDPTYGKALLALGQTLRKLKRFDEAERVLTQAAEHAVMAYVPLTTLGNMYMFDLGREREGIEMFRRAVADLEAPRKGSAKDRPVSGVPYLSLGAALRRTGDRDGARAAFTGATRFADTRATAEAQLAALAAPPPPATPPPTPSAPAAPGTSK